MAIMAVKIEDSSTLRLNEFFDYNGRCYGLSRSRSKSGDAAAELEDFYECTVLTDWIEDTPVVFVCESDSPNHSQGLYICGWYKQAKIYRRVFFPSLFLESNICARSTDAILLEEASWILAAPLAALGSCHFKDKLYRVIEDDEEGYEELEKILNNACGRQVPIRYELAPSQMNKGSIRRAALSKSKAAKKVLTAREAAKLSYDYCIEQCASYAKKLMGDQCESIEDIKTLREYGEMAVTFFKNCPDGYYYKAMAEEQLGFVKEGLRSVNRALQLEPDGADIIALKANLLAAMGSYEDAAALYSESFDISGDESYLLVKGRVLLMMGNVDAAYKVFREITDRELLLAAGINLKDMEHRWPFVAIRGLKSLLKKS